MSRTGLRLSLASCGISVVTAVVMILTEPRMAIVWDEAYTLGREARIREWIHGLGDPARWAATWRPPEPKEDLVMNDGTSPPGPERVNTRSKLLFDRRVVDWFWPFAREEPHGHPPFYALVGLTGDLIAPTWKPLPRARLGPILVFSVAAGAIFQFVARRWGAWPAAVAAAAWVLQPNLFGHGHYASYDALLTSLWVLSIFAFTAATEVSAIADDLAIRWNAIACFGLLMGCAFATKFTGWFLPLPFLGWAVLYRDARALKTLVIGVLIAVVLTFVLVPPWWSDPIDCLFRFFRSNLTRSQTAPLRVQFLGTVYDTPGESLPWFNTLVWTVMVTPVGFLAFACAGVWSGLRSWRREPIGLLLVLNWAFLIILRALPGTPGHDGVRLFLPAFGVLAVLVGVGARFLIDRWRRWASVLGIASILEGIVGIAVMMPVPLSYFSPLVGGLPGATALGMEPTYYWDALGPETLRWLTEHTPPGQTILFAARPNTVVYLRQVGDLPRRVSPSDPGKILWVVVQNRPGALKDIGRALVERGHPRYTVSKLGVPLLWIFTYSELEELARVPRPDA